MSQEYVVRTWGCQHKAEGEVLKLFAGLADAGTFTVISSTVILLFEQYVPGASNQHFAAFKKSYNVTEFLLGFPPFGRLVCRVDQDWMFQLADCLSEETCSADTFSKWNQSSCFSLNPVW